MKKKMMLALSLLLSAVIANAGEPWGGQIPPVTPGETPEWSGQPQFPFRRPPEVRGPEWAEIVQEATGAPIGDQ